jgi:hypothetical protein
LSWEEQSKHSIYNFRRPVRTFAGSGVLGCVEVLGAFLKTIRTNVLPMISSIATASPLRIADAHYHYDRSGKTRQN